MQTLRGFPEGRGEAGRGGRFVLGFNSSSHSDPSDGQDQSSFSPAGFYLESPGCPSLPWQLLLSVPAPLGCAGLLQGPRAAAQGLGRLCCLWVTHFPWDGQENRGELCPRQLWG